MIKKISRSIALIGLFIIPFYALIVADPFFFPFITGKGFFFRIIIEITFVAWLILACGDKRYRPRINALSIAVTVFTIIALIADILGVNFLRSFWSNFERMEGFLVIVHLWMFFIVSSSLFGGLSTNKDGSLSQNEEESKKWWHRWFNVYLFVGGIVACYGFAQIFGWLAIHQGSTRIDASLGNAAYMAVYMLTNAGLAAYLLFSNKKEKWTSVNWLYFILTIVFSFLLFETATRGTTIGLVGGILLALLLYGIFGKRESKKNRQRAFALIGIIIVLCAGLYLARNTTFVHDHEVLNRLANISWSESKGQARNFIWPMAIKGWTERPILGWGQENFNYVFNYNYNPHMWSQEQWFDRAHSVFLDWLIAGGIVGLLAYLSLYFLFFRIVWKSNLSIGRKSALLGLMIAYAIHNVFVFDNLASYIAFFALISFASSYIRKAGSEKETVKVLCSKEISTEYIEYIIVPLLVIVLIFSAYFFNIRGISANRRLMNALKSCVSSTPDSTLFEKALAVDVYMANQEIREQLLTCANQVIANQQIANGIKQNYFSIASKAIEDQIKATPKDARMYILGGQLMSALGQSSSAKNLLEVGHILSPYKPMVDISLGETYLNLGFVDQGLKLLETAYNQDTSYPLIRKVYANALIIAGKESKAREIFNNDPEIFNTEELARIYAALKQYEKSLTIYRGLVSNNSSDINLRARYAQILNMAGYKSQAIEVLRGIEKDNPSLKDQIEAAIKSIE